jgi:teichuronic acid biosynthesis glycosyltransferase TuaC
MIENYTNVVAVPGNFPSPRFPEKGIFVKNILNEISRQGANVDVIAPISWVSELKTHFKKSHEIDTKYLTMTRPAYTTLPLSYFKGLKKAITAFNEGTLVRAIRSAFDTDKQYQYCYTHFLPAGRAALKIMSQYNIPVILNLGESDPWIYDELYNKDRWVKELDEFAGIITVSQKNRKYLLKRNSALEDKVRYIPNGVDTNRFKPINQEKCRKMLNLPTHEKIVVFSGHFEERKGPLRVLEALDQMQGKVKGVFLGAGNLEPKGSNVLFADSVVNDEIQYWLNAADIFVLPSLSEGMSNSVLEALACGLPLVVSDRDFNKEFLSEECAVFIDPNDSMDIKKGIEFCLNSKFAENMSKNAIAIAKEYSLEERIHKINEFIEYLGIK